MAFSSRAVRMLFLSLALCQMAAGVASADATLTDNIQQAFKVVTTMSAKLRVDTEQINQFNAPTQGIKISQGFIGIITTVAQVTAQLAGANANAYKLSPLSDDDAKLVVQSLTTFVKVHQDLLKVVISKHGLLTLIPFLDPIRVSLVSLEATVDAFAFTLIGLIPTQKPAVEEQFGSLSVTITQAIKTYEPSVAVQLLESATLSDH